MNTVIKTGGKKLCVKFRLIRLPSQGPFVLFTDISRIDVKPLSYKISYKNTAVSDRLAQSNDLHWKLIVEKKNKTHKWICNLKKVSAHFFPAMVAHS